ncbi:MAG: DUF2795 domain-containing protein [Syntrophobacteraceae bacterium]|nr:DUF2795 domain-containing protein [Syntrophobacteraceae bacterium]
MTRGVKGHSPANVMKHLKGLDFPADKSKILAHAGRAPGPHTREVFEHLGRIPDREYRSPAEVMAEIGRKG